MPKIIRSGVFETNSSSAHSLAIPKKPTMSYPQYNGQNIDLDLGSYDFYSEATPGIEYTKFEDKLAYIYSSIFYHFQTVCVIKKVDLTNLEIDGYDLGKMETVGSSLDNGTPQTTDYGASILRVGYCFNETGLRLISLIEDLCRKHCKVGRIMLYNVGWKDCKDWYKVEDRYVDFTYTIKGVKSTPVYPYDWICFERYPNLEYPLPLSILFDKEKISKILFSTDTIIRIGTDNGDVPLSPKLTKTNDYIGVRNYDPVSKILADYHLVYNGNEVYTDLANKQIAWVSSMDLSGIEKPFTFKE